MQKKDQLLAYLKEACPGLPFATSGRELESALAIPSSDLRKLVNTLRKEGKLVGSSRAGYFYITTFGEAQCTLRHLEGMIRGLEAASLGLLRGLNQLPLADLGGDGNR